MNFLEFIVKVILIIIVWSLIIFINKFYIFKKEKKANELFKVNNYDAALEIYDKLVKKEFFQLRLYLNKLTILFNIMRTDEFNVTLKQLLKKRNSITKKEVHIYSMAAIVNYIINENEIGDYYLNKIKKYSKNNKMEYSFFLLLSGIKAFHHQEFDDAIFFFNFIIDKIKYKTIKFIASYFLIQIYQQQDNKDELLNHLATIKDYCLSKEHLKLVEDVII